MRCSFPSCHLCWYLAEPEWDLQGPVQGAVGSQLLGTLQGAFPWKPREMKELSLLSRFASSCWAAFVPLYWVYMAGAGTR